MKERRNNKKYILGQYFTRPEIVKRVVMLTLNYKHYNKDIKILEPSFGTGNFIAELKHLGFTHIKGCEIDPELTSKPCDFFLLPLTEKFDLIIGNPPFTKFNIKESYYYPTKYLLSDVKPKEYLPPQYLKKEKIRIEEAFILKSLHHLKDHNSAIGFVLPVSFFVKGKSKTTKKEIIKKCKTVIIYQNEMRWVDEPIPCVFAIFTNIKQFENKLILIYENNKNKIEILPLNYLLDEEVIPKTYLFKKENGKRGIPLSQFLLKKQVKYKKSYMTNNINASNILKHTEIPPNKRVEEYTLAVVRVGNSSVGRSGLINIKEDVLNDMFYVFQFKPQFDRNKQLKELIVKELNKHQAYFRNVTSRVGSKSLKKKDILEFRLDPTVFKKFIKDLNNVLLMTS